MREKTGFILLIFGAICFIGILLGFYYSSLPENNPEKNKANCDSLGGKWVENGEVKCLLSYKKAGVVCTDGGQCESGVCFPPALTKDQEKTIMYEPIYNIMGTCYPENKIEDCVNQVINGAVSKDTMCFE